MPEGFTLEFEVDGQEQVARTFSRFGENVKDLRDAFAEIVANFYKGEEKQFASQGGYGAGGWEALAPSTVEYKQRYGFPEQILVRGGELLESLMGENPWSILELEPLMLRMGTRIPWAVFHQRGTRRMPARPVIMLPEEQKREWTKIIHTHIYNLAGREW